MSATLHIATGGYRVPSGNAGSNPLAVASGYHLGPAVELFGIGFSTDLGFVNFDDLFDPNKNPLLVEMTSDQLSIISGLCSKANPLQIDVRIGGICYVVPPAVAARLRAGTNRQMYWRTTLGERGSFRFFSEPPPVF